MGTELRLCNHETGQDICAVALTVGYRKSRPMRAALPISLQASILASCYGFYGFAGYYFRKRYGVMETHNFCKELGIKLRKLPWRVQ